MSRWASLLLGACLALCCIRVVGADGAAGVRAQLAESSVLRGRFEQVKQLQGFRNPLRSGGAFLLARERGVIWDTQTPFPSTVVLTRERLLVRQPDGSTRILLDRRESAAMAAVNALLMALIAGDLDTLSTQFELQETTLPDGSWRLVLLPRDAALTRAFARILLSGDRHVREVAIEERAGDRSTIRFIELREQPAELSVDEARRFD